MKYLKNLLKSLVAATLIFGVAVPPQALASATVRDWGFNINPKQVNYRNFVPNPYAIGNTIGWTATSATVATDTTTGYDFEGLSSFAVTSATNVATIATADIALVQPYSASGNCQITASYKDDASKWQMEVRASGGSTVLSSVALTNSTNWSQASINYPCTNNARVYFTSNAASPANFHFSGVYYGPVTNLTVQPIVTNWVPYTPTGAFTTNTTYTGAWRRNGDSMEIMANMAFAGAPNSVTSTINLPSGYTMDTTKIPGFAGATSPPLGDWSGVTAATGRKGHLLYNNTTSLVLYYQSSTAAAEAPLTQASPGTIAAADSIALQSLTLPIVGWSASQSAVSQSQQQLPTIQKFTSGTAQTYTTPAGVVYIRVRMVGGGGGGGGGGTTGGSAGGSGTASTFGTTLLSAGGGAGGALSSTSTIAAGGTSSLGTGPTGTALAGGTGGQGGGGFVTEGYIGGGGGGSAFGGGGANGGGGSGSNGGAGSANTGAGGGGGAAANATNSVSGGGGGAGGFVDAIITTPLTTYSYTVGASGAAGTNGTSGFAGGAGAAGYIEVTEYYSTSTPLLVGSITSNSSGLERIERAVIVCSSSSSVTSQSGSWISSVTNISSNRCTINLTAGMFSAAPTCTGAVVYNGASSVFSANIGSPSTSSVGIGCTGQTGGTTTACTGGDIFNIVCMGPR